MEVVLVNSKFLITQNKKKHSLLSRSSFKNILPIFLNIVSYPNQSVEKH